jgi:hypothetical protein
LKGREGKKERKKKKKGEKNHVFKKIWRRVTTRIKLKSYG